MPSAIAMTLPRDADNGGPNIERHRVGNSRRYSIGAVIVVASFVVLLAIGLFAWRRQYQYRLEKTYQLAEAYFAAHQQGLANAIDQMGARAGIREIVHRAELPPSLQAPGIEGAVAAADHVTLIVSRTPDVDKGFRIWRTQQTSDYADRPTSVPGVYRFTYCDDLVESPSNRPW